MICRRIRGVTKPNISFSLNIKRGGLLYRFMIYVPYLSSIPPFVILSTPFIYVKKKKICLVCGELRKSTSSHGHIILLSPCIFLQTKKLSISQGKYKEKKEKAAAISL